MTKIQTNFNSSNSKPQYDLEDRTLQFSKLIISLVKLIKPTLQNRNILDQLLRSATSIGANYREANDALGKKDFLQRLRITRKEAKETIYWLELLLEIEPQNQHMIIELLDETTQLKNIFSAIISKSDH